MSKGVVRHVNAGKTSTLVHIELTALHVTTPKTRMERTGAERKVRDRPKSTDTAHDHTSAGLFGGVGVGTVSAKLW